MSPAVPRPTAFTALLFVVSLARLGVADEPPTPALVDSIDRHVDEAISALANGTALSSRPSTSCPTVCEAGCRGFIPDADVREPGLGPWQAGLIGGLGGLGAGAGWAAGIEGEDVALRGWRGADYAVWGVAIAAWAAPKLFDKRSPDLAGGVFSDCKGTQDRLWSVDRGVRRLVAGGLSLTQRQRAARVSDATLAASVLLPWGGLAGTRPPHAERDALVIAETMAVTLAVNDAVKNIFDRPRPYVHFCEPARLEDLCTRDAQYSFYSGHTSTSFAAAVLAGRLADMHGRGSTGMWVTGLTLATTTGFLRIKADKHYLTDVVVGAVAGGLAGWFLPQLHKPHEDSGPDPSGSIQGSPSPPPLLGVAVPGRSPGTGVLIHAGVGDGVSLGVAWRF